MRQVSARHIDTRSVASSFMNKVYLFMTLGLLITAAVAYYFHIHPRITIALARSQYLFFGIIIVQLGAVLIFNRVARKLSTGGCTLLFFLFSAITGVTFGILSLVYTAQNFGYAFAITAGSFLGLSLVGYTTKKDLTAVGSFCIMGLWGIIIATVLSFFIPSFRTNGMQLVISAIGVIVFAGLTAYDTQKIKAMATTTGKTQEVAAISGAFSLYLDFINLFFFILRLIGGRR